MSAASGLEDTGIALSIGASVADPDSVLSISISHVPAGAALSAGIDNGNGSRTLTPAQLSGLTLTAPEHYSGSFNLSVTVEGNDNGDISSNSANLHIDVAGVATTPTLSVSAASGSEDSVISLNIKCGFSRYGWF